jgi:hypothetical protein
MKSLFLLILFSRLSFACVEVPLLIKLAGLDMGLNGTGIVFVSQKVIVGNYSDLFEDKFDAESSQKFSRPGTKTFGLPNKDAVIKVIFEKEDLVPDSRVQGIKRVIYTYTVLAQKEKGKAKGTKAFSLTVPTGIWIDAAGKRIRTEDEVPRGCKIIYDPFDGQQIKRTGNCG